MTMTTQLLTESPPPGPGVYPGVPMREYAKWPYLNGSLLACAYLPDGTVSMKHLRAYEQGRLVKESADLLLGRAIHTRLLEPHLFATQFAVAGPCNGILKSGPSKGQTCGKPGAASLEGCWFCWQHAPAGAESPDNLLSEAEAAACEELAANIGKHKVVKLFKAHGGVEVSFVWDQPVAYTVGGAEKETTIRMKGRVDKDLPEPHGIPPTVVDLKTTHLGHHTPFWFARQLYEYCYDLKAAIYVDGLERLTGVRREFFWIVVEKTCPYDVNAVRADEETLEVGRARYNDILSRYAACQETGEWPGVNENWEWGGLPAWKRRKGKGSL